ncbi:MAG: aspartyl protease family protein [Planctomycetes bacterium]|nr:aspartyl protease family protein [Planctomycetota bacterium]
MIYFDLDVNGKTVEFLLDTGHTHHAVSRATAKEFDTEVMESENESCGLGDYTLFRDSSWSS